MNARIKGKDLTGSVPIQIKLADHGLQLLVSHLLTKFLCHLPQIFQRDLPGSIAVKEPERLPHLLDRVSLQDSLRH